MITPIYENEWVKLYQGDCLNVMDEFIQNNTSFDIVITSPPYNMNLRTSSGKYISRWGWKGNVEAFSTKYENYKDDLSMEEYFEFQKEFIEKCLEISKLTFYNIQMITGNKVALFKLLGNFAEQVKETIIWDKGYGVPAMKYGTLNSQFEFIFVFSNDKPYNRMFDEANFERGTETNVWSIKRERNSEHKAAFPENLVKRILIDFTKYGNTVFDPFAGSGTTGVVCMENNRKCVLIEKEEKYCEITIKRLQDKEKEIAERLF